LFESGALAKGLSSNRVCTFLIDLSPTDLENPLAQFNHTFPTRDSIWELVRTINLTLKENALKESILARVFDTYWTQFETDFKKIIETTPEVKIQVKRKDDDIMLDVLSTVRMLDRRIRSMETNNDRIFVNEKEISMRENISINELRMNVQNLIEQELSDQVILDVLSDKVGYPRSILRKEIQRYREIFEAKKEKK
jgi:hypothetical protein